MTTTSGRAGPRRRGRPRRFDPEAVLEALVGEFARRGYHATSHEVIRAVTGLSGSSLHHAFGTKRDIFERAVDLDLRRARATVAILDAGKGHAALLDWLDRLAADIGADRAPAGALATRALPPDRRSGDSDTVGRFLDQLRASLEAVLAEATRRGEVEPGRIQCRAATLEGSYLGIVSAARSPYRERAATLVMGTQRTVENWRVASRR